MATYDWTHYCSFYNKKQGQKSLTLLQNLTITPFLQIPIYLHKSIYEAN